MMPLSPYIFEFFIFNSLYQIDWQETMIHNRRIDQPSGSTEKDKRQAFLDYIWHRTRDQPEHLIRAFEPLVALAPLAGDWTIVEPDRKTSEGQRTVTKAAGTKFFENANTIADALRNGPPNMRPTSDSSLLQAIRDGASFVNKVRNNLFHGSKTLGEIHDVNQRRRIEVYELFLKSITSLFFLSHGKPIAGCDIVPYAIRSHHDEEAPLLSPTGLLHAVSEGLMRLGDNNLITRFNRTYPTSQYQPDPAPGTALFYPSAGCDLLTPILLGLPYCTDFYFYEWHGARTRTSASPTHTRVINKVRSAMRTYVTDAEDVGQPVATTRSVQLQFRYRDTPRTIHYLMDDNLSFLDSRVPLRFYFHRGDSSGEGGSDQRWDSDLLPRLAELAPTKQPWFYVTDGQPGGFKPLLKNEADTTIIKRADRPDAACYQDDTYHFGRMWST